MRSRNVNVSLASWPWYHSALHCKANWQSHVVYSKCNVICNGFYTRGVRDLRDSIRKHLSLFVYDSRNLCPRRLWACYTTLYYNCVTILPIHLLTQVLSFNFARFIRVIPTYETPIFQIHKCQVRGYHSPARVADWPK